MPGPDEITEEGVGFFRGTWFIGRVLIQEVEEVVALEGQLIEALDRAGSNPTEFEQLACAAEQDDASELQGKSRERFESSGLAKLAAREGDIDQLFGLEIGVAGLTFALSALRCLTAASCRWHIGERSWSDCPIVFFAAPKWRVEILAGLIASAQCGLASDRDMLAVYGSSIRDMNGLAALILEERARFRRIPQKYRSKPRSKPLDTTQLELL